MDGLKNSMEVSANSLNRHTKGEFSRSFNVGLSTLYECAAEARISEEQCMDLKQCAATRRKRVSRCSTSCILLLLLTCFRP
jgi:hypothetical protein